MTVDDPESAVARFTATVYEVNVRTNARKLVSSDSINTLCFKATFTCICTASGLCYQRTLEVSLADHIEDDLFHGQKLAIVVDITNHAGMSSSRETQVAVDLWAPLAGMPALSYCAAY